MDGVLLGVIMVWVFALFPIVVAWIDCTRRSTQLTVTSITVAICLLLTYAIPNVSYNSARAQYVHNEMLVEMLEPELNDLQATIDGVKTLNPNAMFLSNQDTPIATTMALNVKLIERKSNAKIKAYDARVKMSELENSIFSFACNKLKEEK